MKTAVSIFEELGLELETLSCESEVVRMACESNPWFTAHEVLSAARSIAHTMLRAEALEEWISHYPTLPLKRASRVLIVMAGNIPFVGFFDLLCVVMSGNKAVVKLSSKDSILMRWVVNKLNAIEPELGIRIYDSEPFDAVIATGGESALRSFRSQYSALPSLLRGDRHSVAVLSGNETCEQIQALSQDLFLYSGLGCRNVSMIFAPRDMQLEITPCRVSPLYEDNYRHAKALMTMIGREYVDLGVALLVEQQEFSSQLSVISLFRYDDLSEVERWLDEHESQLQCVVGRCVSHSSLVDFGKAQSPTLYDYADDIDVMQFLASLQNF